MISQVLTEDFVAVNVCSANWIDAVRAGGELLLKNDCIEERYIDEMVNSVKEFGPYIVIEKGIALAHARPEDGVKKIGVSFCVLKNPVEFGNEANDPVKLVISICAVDNNSHLDIISDLANIISADDIMNKIFNCSKKENLFDIICSAI